MDMLSSKRMEQKFRANAKKAGWLIEYHYKLKKEEGIKEKL